MTKNGRAMLLAAAAVIVVMAGMLFAYMKFRPQSVAGMKEITLDVVYLDAPMDSYTIQTDAEYLEQAMEDVEGLTIEGHRTSQMGLMIDSVNGVLADYNVNQTYWSIELDGKPCNYGASQQPVQDGEHYQLVHTSGGM